MNEYLNDSPIDTFACEAHHDIGSGLKQQHILPDGLVKTGKGDFIVDAESAKLILEAFKNRGSELVIDYEHQSLGGQYASPDGTAPAAGWIRSMWYQPGRGVYAMVQWNERARDYITTHEYKRLSPVAIIRKSDRKVVSIDSVALTNKPELAQLDPVVASRKGMEAETMEKIIMAGEPATTEKESAVTTERLIGELKSVLTDMEIEIEGSGRDAILRAAIDKLRGKTDEKDAPASEDENAQIASSIRSKLGISSNACTSEVILSISMLSNDGQAKTALTAMKNGESERLAIERVAKYAKTNVLNPNDKDQMASALALSRQNPERFEQLMNRATPWVQSGQTKSPDGASHGRAELIMTATREFKESNDLQGLTSIEAFVNDTLEGKKLPLLTETEIQTL